MTAREIELLPALIPRKVFLALTGLPPRDMYVMIRSGKLRVFERPWRKRRGRGHKHCTALYYKSEALRLGAPGNGA